MRTFIIVSALACAVAASAQEPPVQNGRVETRAGLTIARALETLGSGPDAVWLAWQVPMVAGDRDLCSTWSDNRSSVRGAVLEPTDATAPLVHPLGPPVALEAASTLVLFARVEEHRIERLVTLNASCPVDAGGRTVYWLSVSSADSVRALEATAEDVVPGVNTTGRLSGSAISAIALHADAAADAALDRLATDADARVRQAAFAALGALRGAHGVAVLTTRLANERDSETRRSLVSALASSGDPRVANLLLDLARRDADPRVRGEAAYGYVRRTGPANSAGAVALLNADADDTVRRRLVAAIAAWPETASVPILIDLVRTNTNLVVRKEAANVLSRSKDPRAVAYFESLLR